MPPNPSNRTSLAELIRFQAAGCEAAGSPLYARVLAAVRDQVDSGGFLAGLLEPLSDTGVGDAAILQFLAAVHEAVLAGDCPDLAAQYPSTGGKPDDDLEAVFLAVTEELGDRVAPTHLRPVQTNEVGRSAALLAGYLTIAARGLPLRILEVGASAGLNLRFDRYRYEADGRSFGPADSPLVFSNPYEGSIPVLDRHLEVVERRGCDLNPIDPASAAGKLRLRSLVWPDHVERRNRLDAALEVAAGFPVIVDEADAVQWLADRLAEPVPGTVTVVAHSIVLQYLPNADRQAMLEVIEEAGRRADRESPVAWLRMEPGGDHAEIRLISWPDPAPLLLGTSTYHGPPVTWFGI